MATMGPRVPLIAPALYENGPRGASSATTPGAKGPQGLGSAQAAGPPKSPLTPGSPMPGRPRVPLGKRPDGGGELDSPAPASPPPKPVETGPGGHIASNFTPQLKRNAGGALSTTYAPPPEDSSFPVLNIGGEMADRDEQGTAPSGSQSGYSDAPAGTTAPSGSSQSGSPNDAHGDNPNAEGGPVGFDRGANGLSKEQMIQSGYNLVGRSGVTDDGMPVFDWSDGKSYIELNGKMVEVVDHGDGTYSRKQSEMNQSEAAHEDFREESQRSEDAARTEEMQSRYGSMSVEELEELLANGRYTPGMGGGRNGGSAGQMSPLSPEEASDVEAEISRRRGRTDPTGQTSSATSALTASNNGEAQTAVPQTGAGNKQPTGPDSITSRVAASTHQPPETIQALRDMGVGTGDITSKGFRLGGQFYEWGDEGNKVLTDLGVAAANVKSGWGATPGQSMEDLEGKQSDILSQFDEAAPEMDQAALENAIGANRRRSAWEQSRALRGALARSAALGMSPESGVGIGGEIAGDFDTRNEQSESNMRMKAMQTNFQAKMQHYQNKDQRLKMLLQNNLSDQDRAVVMAAMKDNAAVMQAMGKDMARFQWDMQSPGAGDQFLAGASAVSDIATGWIP